MYIVTRLYSIIQSNNLADLGFGLGGAVEIFWPLRPPISRRVDRKNPQMLGEFSLKQKPLDGRQEPSKEVDLDIFFTPSGRRRRKERARRPPAPDPYTGQGEYKEGLTTYEKIFKANSAKNKNMNIFIPF